MNESTSAASWVVPKLRGWANMMSARFGGAEIWLVGSACTKEEPNDIDIVIVLDDAAFIRRYGLPFVQGRSATDEQRVSDFFLTLYHPDYDRSHRLWCREMAKQSANMGFVQYPLDIKIQARWNAEHYLVGNEGAPSKPRIRLDDYREPAQAKAT